MATPNAKAGLKQRWDGMSPTAKRNLVVIGAITAFVVISFPMLKSTTEPPRPVTVREEALGNLVTDADPRAIGLSGLSNEVKGLKEALAGAQSEIDSLRGGAQPGTGPDEVMRNELNALRQQIEDLKAQQATAVAPAPTQGGSGTAPAGTVWNPDRPDGTPPLAPPNTGQPIDPQGQRTPITIRTVSAADAKPKPGLIAQPGQAPADAKKDEPPALYMPSGSIIQGVLLNGLDAPTGRGATGDPLPVLVRIRHEAWLPNRYRMDVRDCHVIAAGFGDLPSERAYLRSESISCITRAGGVIDIPIEMYAVGEDGKSGLRGLVVSKQGAILARALLAGFAEGVSNAFQPQVGFGGLEQGGLNQQSLESGFAGGTSSALDRISAYYLKLADQMHPVVSVSGGRPINFVVLRGAEIKLASAK